MKFNHERSSWHCRLCLLMPDHLHAIIAFPREPECKRLSGTGRSSSRESMAGSGNAMLSITACATIMNWRRGLERFHKRCSHRPVAGPSSVPFHTRETAHRTVTTAVLQRLQFYLTRSSYVSMNPVRKGLCERAEDWAWVYHPNDRPPPLLG
jgi:putative transposase